MYTPDNTYSPLPPYTKLNSFNYVDFQIGHVPLRKIKSFLKCQIY